MAVSEEATAEDDSISTCGAQLCPVCGICCAGGPTSLTSRTLDIETENGIARAFLADLRSQRQVPELHLSEDTELLSIIRTSVKACQQALSNSRTSPFQDSRWLCPTWVAIGYFDEDGQAPIERYRTRVFVPDGSNVSVRQVTDPYYTSFQSALCDNIGADGTVSQKIFHDVISNCDIEDDPTCPNVALCVRCFYYLKKWLDLDSLPLPYNGRSLSFAGELYEIVNSQDSRDHSGLVLSLDYSRIERSVSIDTQGELWQCRGHMKHFARALEAGLREGELLQPLLRDCRAWMFVRPDIWPPSSPADDYSWVPLPSTCKAIPGRTSTQHKIHDLPVELHLLIFKDLALRDVLALSATDCALRRFLTNPLMVHLVLKQLILRGTMRWVLPVPGLLDETNRATNAFLSWFADSVRPSLTAHRIKPGYSAEALVGHPRFPLLAFVHACHLSDSMTNRKRVWGVVKQFEGLWRTYRTDGWEVDRFFPSKDVLDLVVKDETDFRPECEK